MASRGLRKTSFFSIWRPVRGETLIFVCFYDVRSFHSAYINRFLAGILHIRKNTQKSKFLLSQTLKWKKMMFFVIPEMPSKTFVMVKKILPDHFKVSHFGRLGISHPPTILNNSNQWFSFSKFRIFSITICIKKYHWVNKFYNRMWMAHVKL